MPNFYTQHILGVPYTTDENGYNWFEAEVDPDGHGYSRNPTTGRLLKSTNHPTFYKTIAGERGQGTTWYKDKNGDIYTFEEEPQYPWPPFEKVETPSAGTIKGTNNRDYVLDNLAYIYKRFKEAGIPYKQNIALLANIAEESGGVHSTYNDTKNYYGLIQWEPKRYNRHTKDDSLDKQINHIINTINNTTDQQSWTDGGKDSGYKSYKNAREDFSSDDPKRIVRGVTLGYVRPEGKLDSVKNRQVAYDKLADMFAEYKEGGAIHIKPENEGKLTRLKQRTGKTESELWSEGNPSVRKMITFARNARKWSK